MTHCPSKRLRLVLPILALCATPAVADGPVPPRAADAFLDSIGYNTHLGTPEAGPTGPGYASFQRVADALAFVRALHVRDALLIGPDLPKLRTLHQRFGICFDLAFDYYKDDGGKALIDGALQNLQGDTGLIEAIEGINEPDQFGFSFDGAKGAEAVMASQRYLYNAIKRRPQFAGVQILCPALSNPSGSGLARHFTDLSAFCDAAPSHVYVENLTLGRNLVRADIDLWSKLPAAYAPGRSPMITEAGWATRPDADEGVDEDTQAKYLLTYLLDAFDLGIRRTYIYELLDERPDPQSTSSEFHYGIFRFDGSPKPAAQMLSRLSTLLGGGPARLTPLPLKLEGLPDSGHSLLLGRADGSYALALWNEAFLWNRKQHRPVEIAVTKTTLDLGKAAVTVEIADPVAGTAPTTVRADATGRFTIALPGHPVFVLIKRRT